MSLDNGEFTRCLKCNVAYDDGPCPMCAVKAQRDSLAERLKEAREALERLTSRVELCLRGVAEYTELRGLVAESRAALAPASKGE